jgi:hypothetical protein
MEQSGASLDELVSALEADWLYGRWVQQRGQWGQDQQLEWERGLALDYQHLLTFQTSEGGFSAFGDSPTDVYRSALALRCLTKLAESGVADRATIDRLAVWLLRQQSERGTWRLAETPLSWSTLPDPELPVTAYVTWSLIDAGYGDAPEIDLAIEYQRQQVGQSEDPYVWALVANALLSYGAEDEALEIALMRLVEQAERVDGVAFWPNSLQTLSGAADSPEEIYGYQTPSARVEIAALAVLALSRSGAYPGRMVEGLAMLTDSRDVRGGWNAPSSTAMALEAISTALSLDPDREMRIGSTVTVTVDGIAAEPVTVDRDEVSMLVFDQLSKGYNDVEIAVQGDEIGYQIVGSYYLPWGQVVPLSAEEEEVSIEVTYDRTSLEVGESVTATVGVMLNRTGTASLVALHIGLPPGFSVMRTDLNALVSSGKAAHYELMDQKLLVYLHKLSTEEPVEFSFRMRAKYPVRVLTPPTYALDVANPQRPAVREPIEITVREDSDAR